MKKVYLKTSVHVRWNARHLYHTLCKVSGNPGQVAGIKENGYRMLAPCLLPH